MSGRPLDHDLEPDPEPTVTDVLEGIGGALDAAVDLASPRQTAARCLTISGRVQVAVAGHITPDELLGALRRLVADWGA
jgi:hypothetical protein